MLLRNGIVLALVTAANLALIFTAEKHSEVWLVAGLGLYVLAWVYERLTRRG